MCNGTAFRKIMTLGIRGKNLYVCMGNEQKHFTMTGVFQVLVMV